MQTSFSDEQQWFFHYFILIYKRKYYTTYVTQDKPYFSPRDFTAHATTLKPA